MTTNPTTQVDILRIDLTYKMARVGISVLVGILLIDFIFLWLVPSLDKSFVSAATATVVSAIGTLVGFVAGHTAGAQGKEKAEAQAAISQTQAEAKQEKINKALAAAAAGNKDFDKLVSLLQPD